MPCTARSSTYWSRLQRSRFAAKDRSFEKPLSACPTLDEARDHRWRALISLSERILRAKSAIEELELWCQQNRIGDGRIVAIADNDAAPHALDGHECAVADHQHSFWPRGSAIARLAVHILVRRCTPGQFAELRSADNCRFVFEHRAVVRAADGAPLAVVHERFLKTLLGAAA
jgi:hypothetical protein